MVVIRTTQILMSQYNMLIIRSVITILHYFYCININVDNFIYTQMYSLVDTFFDVKTTVNIRNIC